MQKVKNKEIYTNFLWRFFERCGAQTVTFVVSIVLARLLDPSVYGMVAIVTIITSILQVFLDGGFSVALIQKKDADDIDFSSVFYFNVAVGLLLYAMLFFSAPVVAKFYKISELTDVIRVLGLTLIIFSLKSVQQAYVSKNLMFRKFFYSTLGGTIGAAIIGIIMAYKGFGVWALVVQNLVNMSADTIILWYTVRWRPIRRFSFSRLKSLLKFGWKLLASGLLDVVFNNLYQIVVGKVYTTADLAYFNKGIQFPYTLVENINISIDSVLLPVMSREQENMYNVRVMTRRAISISTYIIMPMMMGLAVCAIPLTRLLLTEKWLPMVPYLRIFCFTNAFYTIHTANLNAIKALGRSDVFLKLEIIKKIIGLTALLVTIKWGPLVMAYSCLITNVLAQIINAWPNRILIGYSYLDQLKDIMPQILLSSIMGAIVYSVELLCLSDMFTLLIQIPLGIAVYCVGSKVLHIESYEYTLSMIRQVMSKKNG